MQAFLSKHTQNISVVPMKFPTFLFSNKPNFLFLTARQNSIKYKIHCRRYQQACIKISLRNEVCALLFCVILNLDFSGLCFCLWQTFFIYVVQSDFTFPHMTPLVNILLRSQTYFKDQRKFGFFALHKSTQFC